MNTRPNILELANEKLTTYLTQNNLRKTPERYEILRIVVQMNGIFTIDELATRMDEDAKFQVSRATLFNVLGVLTDAQIVIKHAFARAAHYECNLIPHPIICTRCLKCGRFEKADMPQLEATLRDVKSRKLSVMQQILYLSGICRKCEAKERKEKKTASNQTTPDNGNRKE